MKYIVNENNSCGAASLSDELRNRVLESLGFESNKAEVPEQITESVSPQAEADDSSDMPTLYEWDGSVFALDDEVFEIEGDLFLKAIELDSGTRMSLDESHADLFINEVKFEQEDFSLGDIYDFGEEIFIKLDEAVDYSKGDAYARTRANKYARGSDGDMEFTADVKSEFPDWVHPRQREKEPKEEPKKEPKKAPETPQQKLKRQTGNLNPNSAKGREKISGLKQLEKAKELDARDKAAGRTQGTKTKPNGTTSAPAAIPRDRDAEAQAKKDAQ